MDIKLVSQVDATNPNENDIALTAPGGDVIWLGASGVIDPQEVAQHIKCRLRLWKTDEVTSPDEGMPYLDEILDKGVPESRIAIFVRQMILGTPGVSSLASLSLNVVKDARTLNVSFVAVLDSGHVLNSDDFGPFILEV